MDDGFESWARSEIIRLRADAEHMERALALFLASRRQHAHFSASGTTHDRQTHQESALESAPRQAKQRITKNEPIFQAFEKAGASGLNMDDVERIAREVGLNANRNALRALCWNAKKDGRLVSIAPGRYAIAPRNGATVDNLEKGETVAPARTANDQCREGDAGGGT